MGAGRNVTLTHVVAHCISGQVPCLPLRCWADSIFPGVATDHHAQKRAEQGVTRHPTGNPIEQRCRWPNGA